MAGHWAVESARQLTPANRDRHGADKKGVRNGEWTRTQRPSTDTAPSFTHDGLSGGGSRIRTLGPALHKSGWDPELLRLELGELKLGGFDSSSCRP
jgi:hypothetical protein